MKDPEAMQYIRETAQQEQVRNAKDWGQLCRYKAADAEQAARGAPRVVFLGDSITELWGDADPTLFSAKVLDRGISGQTSSQILLRVYPDVIALHPSVLHLMAGTNDVLGQTGPISDDDIVDNVKAMIELAQANGIAVVLASLPPSQGFMGRANLHPAARIARLNDRFRRLAAERKAIFADYHAVLDNGQGGMRTELSNDGLHPNRAGYARMRPVVESALRKVAG